MARKKENDYFDALVNLADYCKDASKLLNETLKRFDPDEIEMNMKKMHEIEHDADIQRHLMLKKLAREFITPIERQDIMEIASAIDTVTDTIEDVLSLIYMFHITKIKPEAIKLCELVALCCSGLKNTLEEFRNFKKSDKIQDKIIEINQLEEQSELIFKEAIRKLYANNTDPIEVSSWEQILYFLEKCCGACEEVVDKIEGVIIKNV